MGRSVPGRPQRVLLGSTTFLKTQFGADPWEMSLEQGILLLCSVTAHTTAPHELHPANPGWYPPRTIVNVILSISCLSLVLCCRKGLCLGKKGQSPRSENGNVQTEAGCMRACC